MNSLNTLGWTPFFEKQLAAADLVDREIARVTEEQRGSYRIAGVGGERHAALAGRLRHDVEQGAAVWPCVGDWVLAEAPPGDPDATARIHRVLERRTKLSRKATGRESVEQVIAANVDTVFLVQSLNRDLNLRRLERYLAILWESGAEPVVVLSKSDLCADPAAEVEAVERAAAAVAVHVTSALAPGGLDAIEIYLRPGRTIALVGSSGVGKSTIVNSLLGEERMRVRGIRDDDRGRHTTTSRHLVSLPGGGLLLDTPGMRTVILGEAEDGVGQVFEDVEALAGACRFADCKHETEPGCAVRGAIESGALDSSRLGSYVKLQREARHHAMKVDARLRRSEQQKWRRRYMEQRRRPDKRKI